MGSSISSNPYKHFDSEKNLNIHQKYNQVKKSLKMESNRKNKMVQVSIEKPNKHDPEDQLVIDRTGGMIPFQNNERFHSHVEVLQLLKVVMMRSRQDPYERYQMLWHRLPTIIADILNAEERSRGIHKTLIVLNPGKIISDALCFRLLAISHQLRMMEIQNTQKLLPSRSETLAQIVWMLVSVYHYLTSRWTPSPLTQLQDEMLTSTLKITVSKILEEYLAFTHGKVSTEHYRKVRLLTARLFSGEQRLRDGQIRDPFLVVEPPKIRPFRDNRPRSPGESRTQQSQTTRSSAKRMERPRTPSPMPAQEEQWEPEHDTNNETPEYIQDDDEEKPTSPEEEDPIA